MPSPLQIPWISWGRTPADQTRVPYNSCMGRRFVSTRATWEAPSLTWAALKTNCNEATSTRLLSAFPPCTRQVNQQQCKSHIRHFFHLSFLPSTLPSPFLPSAALLFNHTNLLTNMALGIFKIFLCCWVLSL